MPDVFHPAPDIPTEGDLPDTIDGWKQLLLDTDRKPLCGWTDQDVFVAWASTEKIAQAFIEYAAEALP